MRTGSIVTYAVPRDRDVDATGRPIAATIQATAAIGGKLYASLRWMDGEVTIDAMTDLVPASVAFKDDAEALRHIADSIA